MSLIPENQEALLQQAAQKLGWSDEKTAEVREIIEDAYREIRDPPVMRWHPQARERARPNDTEVHVYVMQADNGDVKIGISQNPDWRAKQLSTEWRGAPSIKWVSDARSRREATDIERAAHSVLDEERLDGEWFSCSVYRAVGAVRDQIEARA